MSENSKAVFDKMRAKIHKKISNKKPSSKVSKEIKEVIRVRAQLGKDKHDKPYEGLNAKYKKTRKKTKLSNLTTANKSNLTRTGKMFAAMKSKSGKMSVTIYFKDKLSSLKEEWAREGSDNRPVRDFFGVSTKDDKKIKRIIRKWIIENL